MVAPPVLGASIHQHRVNRSSVFRRRPKMFSRELPDAAWHGIPCRGPSTRLTRSSLGLGQDDRVLVAWLKLAFSRVRPSLRRVDESRFAVSKPYPTHTAPCPNAQKRAFWGPFACARLSGRKHLAISFVFQLKMVRRLPRDGSGAVPSPFAPRLLEDHVFCTLRLGMAGRRGWQSGRTP